METLIIFFAVLVTIAVIVIAVMWVAPALASQSVRVRLKRAGRTICAELAVLDQPRFYRRYPLAANSHLLIGRGALCDVVLSEPHVSRNHAAIRCDGDGSRFMLQDLGSENGVFVDGKRVKHQEIKVGTQFRIGQTILALLSPDAPIAHTHTPMTTTDVRRPSDGQLPHRDLRRTPPDYVIDEVCAYAAGHRATVYRARKRSTGETVALKFLTNPHNDLSGGYLRQQLDHQLRRGTSVHHPCCARILDGDATFDPPYFVEEFLAGGSLASRMRRLSQAEAVRVIGQVCDGLDYLHHNGIVHGHLTPHSILFDAKDNAHVNDYSLPRPTDICTVEQLIALFGDMAYLSVEHWRGDLRQVGPCSDQYALGIIAYELFTGRLPFAGSDAQLRERHLRAKPQSPGALSPGLPQSISDAILKALEKNPHKRHADLKAMADAFGYAKPFHRA